MARIDYYNDPAAPKANSIVPSVTAIVPNDRGELLMVHKTDNDLWALPGGGMDLGEYMAEAVAREVLEETGIQVEVTGVVGIYTNPHHVMAYDDGEVRQQCSVCFTTRVLGGELRTSSETKEVGFVDPASLARLNIDPSMRLRSLDRGAGVVGHQAAEPPVDPEGLQVAGAVQRMQPRGCQRWGIADVVQPRRSDQDLPLVSGEHSGSDPAGLLGDHLDVRPTCAERPQEALCVAASPLDKRRHSTTIPGRERREVGVQIPASGGGLGRQARPWHRRDRRHRQLRPPEGRTRRRAVAQGCCTRVAPGSVGAGNGTSRRSAVRG